MIGHLWGSDQRGGFEHFFTLLLLSFYQVYKQVKLNERLQIVFTKVCAVIPTIWFYPDGRTEASDILSCRRVRPSSWLAINTGPGQKTCPINWFLWIIPQILTRRGRWSTSVTYNMDRGCTQFGHVVLSTLETECAQRAVSAVPGAADRLCITRTVTGTQMQKVKLILAHSSDYFCSFCFFPALSITIKPQPYQFMVLILTLNFSLNLQTILWKSSALRGQWHVISTMVWKWNLA